MKINIPQGWHDISTELFIELSKIAESEFNSFSVYNLEVLSIITDTDKEDDMWQDMDTDELIDIYKKSKWLLSEPHKKHKKNIDTLSLSKLTNMTLGEFIDIEHFFSINPVENIHIIAAILYKNIKKDKWNNNITEPYEYDVYERSNQYLLMKITDIYGIINYYNDWKKDFMDNYSNLFEQNIELNEDEMFEGLDEDEIVELKKDIENDNKIEKWNWERIIYQLANNDITKFNDILNINIILIFNLLSMKKDLNI